MDLVEEKLILFRYSGGCGVVRNGTGTFVVVVGGYYNDYMDTVEVYSVEEEVWATGRALVRDRGEPRG